ncbi:GGDEF domain-containing protein [Anatilimnocola floriformis]|uniref:GGDEF domain-containing protein n=1 Tax=Anatilimnocola floriformis TaxID=2948575 RepID=UPI0020C20035|nr:GGDEF domain-containing protein [Anatilimnocola floriformis]
MSWLALLTSGFAVILAGAGLGYGLAAIKYLAELRAAQRERLDLQQQLKTATVRQAASVARPAPVPTSVVELPTDVPDVVAPPPESPLELVAAGVTAEPPPNSASWQQLIHEAAQRAQSDVLCIVDIDFLRQYRERYGQELGDYVSDHVLRVMQDSLQSLLPDSSTDGSPEGGALISRYEGQEFIIAWPAEAGSAQHRLWAARKMTAKLRADIERAFLQIGAERLTITASLGLALCEPGLAGEHVIGRADEALATAKRSGRNCAYYHTGETCRPVEPIVAETSAEDKDAATKHQARRGKNGGRERRRHERKRCDSINLLAPCSDGLLPSMDKFQRVQFFDISSSGFSMIVPTVPAANQFAVALINSQGMIFLAAEVANIRQAHRPSGVSKPLLIVGCRFLQRLYPHDKSESSSRLPGCDLTSPRLAPA